MEYPSKLYYSISEVAEITGVKAHVLRYWESEFPTLSPKKTRAGARRYRQKDIQEIEAIKSLLYNQGFKIAGARKQRREARKAEADQPAPAAPQLAMGFDRMDNAERLAHVRRELQEVLGLIQALRLAAPAVAKPKAKKAEG
ncbi:MAG: MerR family transcriptional regulator [Krumholzibacteria bacterium]|nr:MerR family transcriptional regulator [Candidatus Krumholzibacteria bacterium]